MNWAQGLLNYSQLVSIALTEEEKIYPCVVHHKLIIHVWCFIVKPFFECRLCSPWLSQTGVVPVHSPERVQFLWADPYRVNPSWQEKLCVSPTWSHWSLGQKSPLSNWSWAGHNTSWSKRRKDRGRKDRGLKQRVKITDSNYKSPFWTSDFKYIIQNITFACGPWHLSAIG